MVLNLGFQKLKPLLSLDSFINLSGERLILVDSKIILLPLNSIVILATATAKLD